MGELDEADRILMDCARLWCSNPYLDGFDAARRTAERKLQERWGEEVANEVRRAVRRLGREDGAHQEVALLIMGFARYTTRYRSGVVVGPSDVGASDIQRNLSTRELTEAFRSRGWNLAGVLAAAARCEDRLKLGLCGRSAAIRRARADVWSAAFGSNLIVAAIYARELRRQNVLILGESGTGKEEAAQAVLAGGFLPTGDEEPPKQSVNVAAVPEGLVESELFGHVQGAFTGAVKEKVGVIELARGGALFIDEVGELPTHVQAKFLRVMETGSLRRVGDGADRPAEVRFVGATHRDVAGMVKEGTFRHDLFHRLNGVVVRLPPLREVIDHDLVPILHKLLPETHRGLERQAADQIHAALPGHQWPGNVRELRNVALTLLLRGPEAIRGWDREPVTPKPATVAGPLVPADLAAGRWTESQMVIWYRQKAIEAHPTRAAAARALGVSTRTLERFRKNGGGTP